MAKSKVRNNNKMKLSAPIFQLKRRAHALARQHKIPLHQALDRIASSEGFESWSLLASKFTVDFVAEQTYSTLQPGNLVLIASRRNHGKTTLAMQIGVAAMRAGHACTLFSHEYTSADCASLLKSIGVGESDFGERFHFDGSDQIDADYIVASLVQRPAGTVAIIDYLQLLDQNRRSAPLEEQVSLLRAFAKEHGHILLFITQIDRSFEAAERDFPTLSDIRMPNPVDLNLFDRACFLHNGQVRVQLI